jgi:Tol biopolymer transport system component
VTTPMTARGSDPIWSPDGKEVAYTGLSGNRGIFAVSPFGGTARQLFAADDATYVEDWSRDGRWLAAVSLGHGLLIPVAGGAPVPVAGSGDGAAVDELQFAPNAQWVAYGSRRGLDQEVFLAPVPPNGQQWQLSVGGGVQPRWADDGTAVYYLNETGRLMKVDLAFPPGAPPRLSAPREVRNTGVRPQFTFDQYRVSRDGSRVLVRRTVETAADAPDQIEIVLNWPSLLDAGATPRRP